MKLTLILTIAILGLSSLGFMLSRQVEKQPMQFEKVEAKHAIEDARTDILQDKVQLLMLGYPRAKNLARLQDSLAQLMGFSYRPLHAGVSQESQQYVARYNAEMKRALTQRYGAEWEACLQANEALLFNRYSLLPYEKEELLNTYILRNGLINFAKHSTKITEANQLLLELNAAGMLVTEQLGTPKVHLQSFYQQGETEELADQRVRKAAKVLESQGIPSSWIHIRPSRPASSLACDKCSLDLTGYARRVEVRYE